MKASQTLQFFSILALFLLRTEAFHVSAAAAKGQRLPTALQDTEESEWYSPPVKVEPKPLRQPGVVPTELKVESPQDLLTFLNEHDGRLSIVKYHASWYVRYCL